ncbi:MAG TPA: diol dehydratase small subunit [Bryobacteraceae bacterium]|nr:diol dehydratase small subunit [Bryobacteraceae bacterium]
MSEDYPLAEKHPDRLRTPTGRPFPEITLDAVVSGDLTMEDLRITGEALEWQARIAEAEGRPQLAENLRRAAELTRVPDERILAIYEALRPGRSDKEALERLAAELERDYGAFRCARLVREAAG